jgi:hypothetical protein
VLFGSLKEKSEWVFAVTEPPTVNLTIIVFLKKILWKYVINAKRYFVVFMYAFLKLTIEEH